MMVIMISIIWGFVVIPASHGALFLFCFDSLGLYAYIYIRN